MARTCGTCTVCCTYLRINRPGVLVKVGLVPCQHLERTEDGCGHTGPGTRNCGIEESKPGVCRDYRCAWLDGLGEEADRPDRCGVLIDRVLPIANCLQAKPIREGAGSSPEGMLAIENMSRDAGEPVLVARFPETKMVRVVGRGIE